MDTLIAAGMKDVYRFYSDGTFIFDFGEFNYNSCFSSIMGKYKIDSKCIIFEVEETSEYINQKVTFGGDADYNSWCSSSGKLIRKKIKVIESDTVSVEVSQDKKTINIAGLVYYKISDDPNAERSQFRILKHVTKPK
jgi:translation initiation factor IF-1